MTRERARTERRDLDKERGEPLAGGAARGGPRALRRMARPLHDWSSRPRILVTNDDGIESRGLLALKLALDAIGETTVVAPDTNQSAVGHQKTLMRPLRSVDLASGDPGEALVERSDVQAVEALAVVAEAAVAWELARAAREKFGGDALSDFVTSHAAYLERISWHEDR